MSSSMLDTWTVDELVARVGSIDRTAALKGLLAWVDRGVLKEHEGEKFILLETADSSGEASKPSGSRPVVEEPPPVVTVQQQQAEQMKVYWQVRLLFNSSTLLCLMVL